ncbi:serine hydrolase domain-containing protein [Pseudomarimonas arenosa]|uniref:Serine hydrolase n=1 Tax=Pseudomarimonas arenosa TaxID=2774145 RepID=A0AAW3ZVG3_9GAMM|nr:serine hydrolase domain-containing protein [Pseudomarimonas arenosa]MBD8528051.1 serine hydrolase [Pseudomarimonas arenosa]
MQRIGVTLFLSGSLLLQVAAAAPPPAPADFERYAEALVAGVYSSDAPGVAVLVMRGDDVLYRGARGKADVGANVPLAPGDLFRIGSVTKQIAAAGLLTLVDAGKVALDDPLSKYLPTYPDGARITIEHLLNHTSGIKSYTEMPGTWRERIRRDLTTEQMVDYFKRAAPDFAPGEAWGYNNSGYVLVGAVIEAATGEPWHRYLERALFQPLGMQDTGYGADPAIVARQVKGYIVDGPNLTPPPGISMTQPHAAGALVSTVDDLARWNRGLHQAQLLKPATYKRMITPIGKAKEPGYGFGIGTTTVRGNPALQHSGGIPGFTSHLMYVPAAHITVAVLQNSETAYGVQDPESLARRLAAAALGAPYPPVTAVVIDPAVLGRYEGVYRVDVEATRELRVIDGMLTAQRTGGPRYTLTAVADDTFVYPDGFTRLQVLRDAQGNVAAMRFWPDGEGDSLDAALTDQALPIDLARPGEEIKRLARSYTLPALVTSATIAMLCAMLVWRRRRRPPGARMLPQQVR